MRLDDGIAFGAAALLWQLGRPSVEEAPEDVKSGNDII
jgi:hypothetical protein